MAKFIKFWQWVNMTNTRTRKRKSSFYRIHQRSRSFFIAAIFLTCISQHSWKRLLLWSSPYCLCYIISYYWYAVQNVIFEDENQYHKCVFQNTFATNIGRNPCHIHAQCIWRVFPALYISLHLVMLHSIILNWIKFSPLMRRWKKLFESLLNVLKVKQEQEQEQRNMYTSIHILCSILCWCTSGNNYSLVSLWVWCYHLDTPTFWAIFSVLLFRASQVPSTWKGSCYLLSLSCWKMKLCPTLRSSALYTLLHSSCRWPCAISQIPLLKNIPTAWSCHHWTSL